MLNVVCRTDLTDGDLGGSRHGANSGGETPAMSQTGGRKLKCGLLGKAEEHQSVVVETSRLRSIGATRRTGGRDFEYECVTFGHGRSSRRDRGNLHRGRPKR